MLVLSIIKALRSLTKNFTITDRKKLLPKKSQKVEQIKRKVLSFKKVLIADSLSNVKLGYLHISELITFGKLCPISCMKYL